MKRSASVFPCVVSSGGFVGVMVVFGVVSTVLPRPCGVVGLIASLIKNPAINAPRHPIIMMTITLSGPWGGEVGDGEEGFILSVWKLSGNRVKESVV